GIMKKEISKRTRRRELRHSIYGFPHLYYGGFRSSSSSIVSRSSRRRMRRKKRRGGDRGWI
ncbi:hypothetical protein CSUI_008649, partial [Cystoisospora suis]